MEKKNLMRIYIFIIIGYHYGYSTLQKYNDNTISKNIARDMIFSVKICNDCFTKHEELTVLIGNWSNKSLNNLRHLLQMNVLNLMEIEIKNLSYYENKQKLYKINPMNKLFKPFRAKNFIIYNVDLTQLKLALYEPIDSIWWNLYGFYVIENTQMIDSCKDVHSILETLWKFDIIFAVFLCYDDEKQINIFTFNPFNNHAPSIWKEISTHEQENNHPLIIFKLSLQLNNTQAVCESIFFEKTRTLAGYPIRIDGADIPHLTPFDAKEKSNFKLRGTAGELCQIVLTKLNATLQLHIRNEEGKNKTLNTVDENGIPYGTFRKVFEGKYDMILEYKFIRDIPDNQIHTYTYSAFCSLSKKEYLSLRNHIIQIISDRFLIYIAGIGLVIAGCCSYFIELKFFNVILDELRMFLGVQTIYQPRSQYGKILFISAVFILMFSNFYFQGELSSLITVKKPAFMDSLKDLIKNNYDVYEPKEFNSFFSNIYNKQTKPIKDIEEFLEKHIHGKKVAFIGDCTAIRHHVHESDNNHIAEDRNPKYYVILIRDHFSLKKRIASIYMRLLDNGIASYRTQLQFETNINRTNNNLNEDKISLNRLLFAFNFFIYGLFLSCVIFFLELFFKILSKFI